MVSASSKGVRVCEYKLGPFGFTAKSNGIWVVGRGWLFINTMTVTSVFGLAVWSLAIVLGGGNDVGSNVAMPAL